MALLTFRDSLRRICPPWLKGGVAEKLLFAIGMHLDAFGDAVTFGVKLRLGNVYTNESLSLIGRERRIRRGRLESDDVYATRLARWLDDHRHRGGPYAMLAQLNAHYTPSAFEIDLVYFSGRAYEMDVDGNVLWRDVDWTPDENAAKWARWWLFYHWPTPVGPDGVWGDGAVWGDGGVWGSDLTVQEVADIRAIPREWNAAHAFGKVVLLADNTELWGYPDGTWGEPGGVWGSPAQLDIG